MRRFRLMLAIAPALVAVGLPAAASATTIDFGSPTVVPPGPGGPYIYGGTQPYDSMGIDFDEGYPAAVADPSALEAVNNCTPELYSDPAHALPDSGGQVLYDACYDTEHFSSWSGWIATLHNSASQVSVDLLSYGAPGTSVVLTGYDFSGDPVGSDTATIPSTGDRTLSISTASADIYFFSVQIPDRQNVTVGGFEVDDVSFNDPGTGAPAILLESTGAEGYPGQTVTANYGVERFNGADNVIDPSVTGLPAYVTNTAAPTIPGSADSGSLSFAISATAPAPKLAPFMFSATSTGVTIAPLSADVSIGRDFLIATIAGENDVSLVAGAGPQDAPVDLYFGGTSGPIKLTAHGLPTGVSASFTPQPATGTPGTYKTITVALKAAGTTAPTTNAPVTIKATLTGSPSVPSETTTIHLWVSTFVLRAQGIAVTQGIQLDNGMLIPSGVNESGDSYVGLPLVQDKKTVVRFFADAYGAPAGVPGVFAQLTAYRDGVDLGSIYNDYGPGTGSTPSPLPDTGELFPAPVPDSELESNVNAFTFTLPRSWTYHDGAPNDLKLVAQVFPPWPDGNNTYTQDCGMACPNTFVLNNVEFLQTGSLTVSPIELTANGQSPANYDQTFAYPSAVMPLADDGFTGFMWLPWVATIDISSIVDAYGPSPTAAQSNQINANGLSFVQNWDSNNGNPTNTMGISANEQTRGDTNIPGSGPCPEAPECFNGAYDNPTNGGPSVVAYATTSFGINRPLSGVSHELFHQMGILHASPACGSGAVNSDVGSESWPPDERGELDGIALNTTSEPYTVIANGLNGFADAYDFMSYCAQVGGGDPNDWVSPTNWEAVFSEFEVPGPGPVPAAADIPTGSTGPGDVAVGETAHTVHASRLPRAAATIDTKLLRVIGFYTANGLQITSVGPQVGAAVAKGTSDYTLTALAANGNVIAHASMLETAGHFDQLGPFIELQGEVPAAGVDSVRITSPTGQTATRRRPATPPNVRVLAPIASRAGAATIVGGARHVVVRWRASSAEHLPLTVSIDYSADGGSSWRTIWMGPNLGHVSLPSFYFAPSTDAMVRVRVNDGFNEAPALSQSFTAADPPPQVSILTPAMGASVQLAGDAPVQLTGDAWDSQRHELGGSSLSWYDGGTLLGTGSSLLAGPLPPGTNTIKLLARDPAGTTATATTTIAVRPVRMPFLRLQIPSRIPPGRDSLVVTATSALAATLSVAGQQLQLEPGLSGHLQVTVQPGASPLILRMAITADGIQVPFAARVHR